MKTCVLCGGEVYIYKEMSSDEICVACDKQSRTHVLGGFHEFIGTPVCAPECWCKNPFWGKPIGDEE